MSETDRELLELAAKSAGLERTHYRDGCFCYTTRLGGSVKWNPLTDDGDALRLAVQLNIDIEVADYGTEAWAFNRECDVDVHVLELAKHCKSSAARRAIVRAAAGIGKAMNGK